MSRRAQAGVTLVELLVVVAIVGVLSTLAVVSLSRPRGASSVADAIGGVIGECVRRASAGGPIRDDVADTGIAARARVVIAPAAGGSQQVVTLERLAEDPRPADTATWGVLTTMATGDGIRVRGFRDATVLTEGQGPGTALVGELVIECRPDGTTEARTLYLEGERGKERARIAVMPLTGEVVVSRGW